MSVAELEKTFKTAKKAWKADKENKTLKKAFKAAKKAFNEAKEAGETPVAAEPVKEKKSKKRKAEAAVEVEEPVKKPKVDVEALQKAVKAAKKANKAAGKTPETKKALKAAKKALAEASAAPAEAATEEAAAEPEAAAEVEVEVEAEVEVEDDISSLKAKKPEDPNACERLFCGNLSWDIDDDAIKEFFKDCGTINDVYWLEDRDTGKFKGCGFITFDSVEMGVKAMELNGTECIGREIKLDYSPRQQRASGKGGKGSKGGKGGKGTRELSEKPEGCTTVFCGNLSFDIDDDKMGAFAKDAGCGEVKAIRWLTDRDSGDFKGCGFVEFWDTDSVDAFVKKNGEDLLGRSIRVDYSKPREKKW